MNTMIEKFEQMLSRGEDTALLRFSLGNAYIKFDAARAAEHLRQAVRLDPDYSAAWKLLGRALTETDERDDAQRAYESGIAVAERRGDVQAVKEMRVFLRRLKKGRRD